MIHQETIPIINLNKKDCADNDLLEIVKFDLACEENEMCTFCQIANHEIEVNAIYENENVMAFLDIAPINEGHVLIIPKEHFLDADEIPNGLLHEIMDVSKRIVSALKRAYSPDGYSIMQNGGAFNDIGHYHMHMFPRYQNDGFGWTDSGKEYASSEDVAEKIKMNM